MTIEQLKEEAIKEFQENWNYSRDLKLKDFIDTLIIKAYEEGKKEEKK